MISFGEALRFREALSPRAQLDWLAVAAAAVALVALVRYKVGLIRVILVAGAAGMVLTLLR